MKTSGPDHEVMKAPKKRLATVFHDAHSPAFSRDGRTLYDLLRVADAREWTAGELWSVDLETRRERRILPAVSMGHYDIDARGRIVFTRTDRGFEGIWLGHLDGATAPIRLTRDTSTRVFFGPTGTVLFAAFISVVPFSSAFGSRGPRAARHQVRAPHNMTTTSARE